MSNTTKTVRDLLTKMFVTNRRTSPGERRFLVAQGFATMLKDDFSIGAIVLNDRGRAVLSEIRQALKAR